MLVPGDLGFWRLVLFVLVGPVIGFLVRRKWRLAATRREEIKRLLVLAAEEAARAELEASAGYTTPVSFSLQPQCAVCYCPTTTRCARCKAVRYCSGKCQIIHWRQGHKEECRPPTIDRENNDEGRILSPKGVKPEQYESYDNSFETEGKQYEKPNDTSEEFVPSNSSCSFQVPCGEADASKIEHVVNGNRRISTSKFYNTSLSDVASSISSESFVRASVSEVVSSHRPENSERLHSADIAPTMPETTFNINRTYQTKPSSPKLTKLINSVNGCNITSSSDGKSGSTTSSDLSIDSSDMCSGAKPSTAFSDFWGAALSPSRDKNASDDLSTSSETSASNLSVAESFLRFSFNELGNAIPPVISCGPETKTTASDDHHAGVNKPFDRVACSEKNSTSILNAKTLLSLGSDRCNYEDSNPTSNSHVLKSGQVSSLSSSPSCAHPSSQSGGNSITTGAATVNSLPLSSSKRSNFVASGTSSTQQLTKSREGGTFSTGASDARLLTSSGRPLMSSERLGKVDGVHAGSDIRNYSPNASNGLKTSVLKVFDQIKPSKLSKHYSRGVGGDIAKRYSDKGLYPYELFVKLYNWNKVEMRPCGLTNCGNSCYANAVLQCLAFTPPLTAYLLQGLHSQACAKREWCFTCEFENLILKAKDGKSPLSPIGILSQIGKIGNLSNGREEDAHEFLRYAIDTMQSVFLKEARTNVCGSLEEETTLIGLTFGGYLRSKIKCMKCHGKSERHEKMMDLTVEIEGDIGSLEEALRKFTATEILDGENKYKCGRCKSYERAKKKLTVLEAPNVLTIALKRFQSGKFGKLNKSIRYPEILDLAPYMSGTSDKSPIYRLYGVVVHLDIGNAAFSGHYVCYVKNIQNKWFKIDDSIVKPVELERVLTKGAYMLLYARCSPRAPSSIRNAVTSRDAKIKIPHHVKNAPSKPSVLQPTRHPSWIPSDGGCVYMGETGFRRIFEIDSSSDNSSLVSGSDEGSCSTESTRDSTSTDDFSDFIFGDSGCEWNGSFRSASDSDTSSSSSTSSPSPMYLRPSLPTSLGRSAAGFPETSGSQTDDAYLAMEGDVMWARVPSGTDVRHRLGDLTGKGDHPFWHSDTTKQCRKLGSSSASSINSFRETDSESLGWVKSDKWEICRMF